MIPRTDKSGFTLIELLVVIAIIAILAAILFPVFIAAKRRAHVAQCITHQHQLVAAWLCYVDDNDGASCGTYMPPNPNTGKYWTQVLGPYMANKVELAYCGDMPNTRVGIRGGHAVYSYTADWAVTIGMSVALGDPYGGTWPIKVSQVRSPKNTILFACSSYYLRDYRGDPGVVADKSGCYLIAPGSKTQPLLCLAPEIRTVVQNRQNLYDMFDPKRHNGKVVIAHVGGHVKVYDRDVPLTPKAGVKSWKHPQFSMWDLY